MSRYFGQSVLTVLRRKCELIASLYLGRITINTNNMNPFSQFARSPHCNNVKLSQVGFHNVHVGRNESKYTRRISLHTRASPS